LDFCIEWFDSNTKENFKIHLEIALEKFEKKMKMFSPLPLGFGPVLWPDLTFFCGPAPPLLPSTQAAHLAAAHQRRALGLLPAPSLLGRAQPLARHRARAAASAFRVTTIPDPRASSFIFIFFPTPMPVLPFQKPPMPNLPPDLFLP
jgi:hypothetical protein